MDFSQFVFNDQPSADEVDPVVTPGEVQNSGTTTFVPGPGDPNGKELTDKAIEEIAAGELQIKEAKNAVSKADVLQDHLNAIHETNAVSRVHVRLGVEELGVELPGNLSVSMFTPHASMSFAIPYCSAVRHSIQQEHLTSVRSLHTLFGDPVQRAMEQIQHLRSAQLTQIREVIAAGHLAAIDYEKYAADTGNVVFVRTTPGQEKAEFINVIRTSLSTFAFTDLNIKYNKEELQSHANSVATALGVRAMQFLLNSVIHSSKDKPELEDFIDYTKMGGTVNTMLPTLEDILKFAQFARLNELPQIIDQKLNQTFMALQEFDREYRNITKVDGHENGLDDFIRLHSDDILHQIRVVTHLTSLCFALGFLFFHLTEMFTHLKLKPE